MKVVEIKENIYWFMSNGSGIIYIERINKVSAIFYENTLCNKITLEILESDYGGDLFIYDDFLLGYQIRKNGISENCLFSKEMTKPILLSNGFGSHVSFTKIGSKRFIFRFSNEDDFNNDWIEVYGDIHRTNLLYKFDNANYFFFFGNDDLLFFYEFNDRFKINCVSAIDGKPLWHKSINDKYWFDRLGNTFPASLNTGKGTLVGEKCILSVMNHGILCLNSITGEVFYEDFNKEFYSYDNFKVYGNKYFHFIYDQNYFPFIRCADADTGIEIYCKKITDVIPSISDENIRNINSHNQSLFFNIHNGYLFFTDWEYLYLLKEDDATLIDSIKIPFVDGVPNGNRSEIKMHGNRIYLNAASTTLDKYDLYVFELDEY